MPFGVCLELYDQVYELVYIEADVPLLLQPLDVGGVAGRQDVQRNFPEIQEKTELSHGMHIVWRVDDEGRRVREREPGGSVSQLEQGIFALAEVLAK